MEKELHQRLETIEEKASKRDDRIEEMASTLGSLHNITKNMSATVASAPSKEVLRPLARSLGEEIAKEAVRSFQDQAENIKALRQDVAEAREALLHVRAVNENKKVVEKDGKLTLEDKGFMDHVVDYGKPVLAGAAGTVAGIALWEGGRAVYDWATADDEPAL